MYTFSGKLKTVSLVLMIIGALGIGYGFFSAPKTTEDIEQAMSHDDGQHGESTALTQKRHLMELKAMMKVTALMKHKATWNTYCTKVKIVHGQHFSLQPFSF